MESKNDKEIYIVQEFLFDNQQEAQLALEEERKIQYLENKMDYSDPSSVYSIYQKMIENSMNSMALENEQPEEEKKNTDYFSHKNHFFIITNAGKPVYTTYLVITFCQT